ncbi:energy transducer TonB [Algoriphagus aquatilis]|uniref:Energy transducer TonB n=1 Tax=Algoriphagus aquatilis TaxID=490186 RepID=A0ABW0C317_9BACT
MKTKLLSLLGLSMIISLVISQKSFSQTTLSQVDGVYQAVPDMPVPPGGIDAWIKYLTENLTYPATAKEKGVEGLVVLTFVVREEGKVDSVEVLRGIGGGCDEEAVRLVKNSGIWTPGKIEGKAVPVRMRLPVQFKL